MSKKILVTGIGGVVGQGIIKNIKSYYPSFIIIGTNTKHLSGGNYLCDTVYEVLPAIADEYISQMQNICEVENIDLIIPSTDYETYYLGLHHHTFNCPIAANSAEISGMCLDKYKNYEAFEANGVPFAKSWLPSKYSEQSTAILVKPREGRGSRGIYFNPTNPSDFDDSFMVQELHEGEEITSSVYVDKSGIILGIITFTRDLENGNTTYCEVCKRYDAEVLKLAQNILDSFPFRGSFNIQSIANSDSITPFEINCRISGTNSVRSQFGFHDVKYTIQELLLNETPSKPVITDGCAIRVIEDIIYPNRSLAEVNNNKDGFLKP